MKTRILTSILFSSVAFLFGPLLTYIHNHSNYSIPFHYLLLIGIISFIASTLLVFLFLLIFRGKLLSIMCALILGISIYMWFSSSFLDWNLGVLDGREINWDALKTKIMNEFVLFVLFLSCCMFFHKRITAKISKICIFLMLVQFAYLSYSIVSEPSIINKNSHIQEMETDYFSFSKKENVIFIVLDHFMNDVFDTILNENSEFNSTFKNFTYFKNTTACFPDTKPTIPMLLHGRTYSNEDGPLSIYQKKWINENSLPLLLQKNGYDVRMKFMWGFEYLNIQTSNTSQKRDTITSIRFWGRRFLEDVFIISVIRKSPLLFKKALLENSTFSGMVYSAILSDINFFYKNIELVNNRNPKPSFRFYHLWGLHEPYLLLRNVTMSSDSSGYKYSSSKVIEQGIGYLMMVDKFLKQLKTINIYDNSTIIICADHGLQGDYLSLPLLLIKPANANKEKMHVSLAPVMLSDVAKTIAECLLLSNDLPGMNAFSLNDSDQRVRKYYFYPNYNLRNDVLPPITKIEFTSLNPREERIQEASNQFYPDLHNSPLFFNKYNKQMRIHTLEEGFYLPEIRAQWTNGDAYIIVNSDNPINMKNSRVRIHITGINLTNTRPTNFLWNNDEIGVINCNNWEERIFVIPAKKIKQQNTMRLFTPDALSPQSLKSNNDNRILGFALAKISFDIFCDPNDFVEFPIEINFGKNSNDYDYIIYGFSFPEDGFRWTDESAAILRFWLPDDFDSDLITSFSLFPYLGKNKIPMQRVEVLVNGVNIDLWELKGNTTKQIIIPASLKADDRFDIEFRLPDAASPKELGLSNDPRKLAVAFRNISFYKLESLSNITLRFGKGGNDSSYIVSGFSIPEDGFRWTDGSMAILRFWLPIGFDSDIIANFALSPYLGRGKKTAQYVDVFVNGIKTDSWELKDYTTKKLTFPSSLIRDNRFDIEFRLPDAISPKELGYSNDSRKLAVAFHTISFEKLEPLSNLSIEFGKDENDMN